MAQLPPPQLPAGREGAPGLNAPRGRVRVEDVTWGPTQGSEPRPEVSGIGAHSLEWGRGRGRTPQPGLEGGRGRVCVAGRCPSPRKAPGQRGERQGHRLQASVGTAWLQSPPRGHSGVRALGLHLLPLPWALGGGGPPKSKRPGGQAGSGRSGGGAEVKPAEHTGRQSDMKHSEQGLARPCGGHATGKLGALLVLPVENMGDLLLISSSF